MSENEKYRSMVQAFRMSELQSLMVFAGRSKAGRKSDLQVRWEGLGVNVLNIFLRLELWI